MITESELAEVKEWPIGVEMPKRLVDVMDEYLAREAYGVAWQIFLTMERPAMTIVETVKAAFRKLFVSASELRPRRQKWLWEKRIPLHEVTLLAGLQGRGKSMVTMYWIAGVTRGSFGRPAADVLLLSAEEDPETTIVPRLITAGADLERVHVHRIEKHFTLPHDVKIVEEAVAEWPVDLVVIDPLLSYLDDDTDSYKPKEVRRALHALNYLKRRTTILAVIHFRKASAQEVLHTITSSSAFTEVPRSVLGLGLQPETDPIDGRLAMVHLKCNVGKKQQTQLVQVEEAWIDDPDGGEPIKTARMVIGEESDLTQEQVFQPRQGRPSIPRDEAKTFLQGELNRHGGRVPVAPTRKAWSASGLGSKQTLDRARADMGLVARVDEEVNVWYWQEPDRTPLTLTP
jgi:hypothetical protein